MSSILMIGFLSVPVLFSLSALIRLSTMQKNGTGS